MKLLRLIPLIALLAVHAGAAVAAGTDHHVLSATTLLTDTGTPSPVTATTSLVSVAGVAPKLSLSLQWQPTTLRPGGVLLHYVWVETDNIPSFSFLPPAIAILASAPMAATGF